MANVGRAIGGTVRATRLTSDERQDIARRGAHARWENLPQAVCGSQDRPLRIAGLEIPCFVLADGTRVLSQAGILGALGRHPKANVRREESEDGSGPVPPILQGKAVREFISAEVLERARPILFRTPQGVRASGYRAELLPDICNIYLEARAANALPRNQEHVAARAEILVRGLATVGIIAMVDEATGYQSIRAANALAVILEEFIAKEIQPWISTFPADFYRELFRLRGLEFPKDSIKRPQYFGVLTNDLVYRRLAPGVLEELRRLTPKSESGRRRHKYFQSLTADMGYPKLREHLGSIVTIMKLSSTWPQFMDTLDRLHPRFGQTMILPLDYDPRSDTGEGI